ncbi:MAG TPA: DUF5684 domain-containing protein [Thermoleophilia bacterium]|nr:DUF5684 domain-containing protein [Thermoleophilia bacterium]
MDYTYTYDAGGGAAAAFLIVMWIVMLVFAILAIIGLWKTLTKAGLPGWAAIIPFYNQYNVVKLSNRPVYFFWIMLGCSLFAWIPILGWLLMIGIFVLWVFIALDIAANFGQGTGFAILLIIFPSIMFLILGFGSYQFQRIAAPGSVGFGAPPMPAGGGYAAAPPPPPAGGYAVPAAPPAAPVAPVTPQAPPAAPVTPAQPVTPAAAPAAPATPPAAPAEAAPAQTAATDAAPAADAVAPEAPVTPPEAPAAPETPSSSPPPPPPLT